MFRRRVPSRWLLAALLAVWICPAFAQEEAGTNPPKADLPYLVHAGNLTETEHAQAVESRKKDEVTYQVKGVSSPARTPLAGPEFLLLSEKLNPDKLRLYAFEPRNGQREITINEKKPKKNAQPYILSVMPGGKSLFKIRVDGSLPRGEYCLTPDGSNDVFCFGVY